MHYLLIPALLLWISSDELVIGAIDIYQSIRDDLKEYNISCGYLDSCEDNRVVDSLSSYACHCGIHCAQLGTCCFDSSHVYVTQPKLKPTCRSLNNGKSYFMVDRCPSSDSVWESLCRDEWYDDVLRIVPVTSLLTSITYKNYFCFKCHETNDEFLYWKVKLESTVLPHGRSSQGQYNEKHVSLNYDHFQGTWIASIENEHIIHIPVNLSMEVPNEIRALTKVCDPDVISSCSERWFDRNVGDKCLAYMAEKQVRRNDIDLKYRNIHCALCNFEKLDDISCKTIIFSAFAGKVPFSFTLLLDINRSDGEEVGKVQKCNDNYVWDPYVKRCRKLVCALPGYKINGGKCVPG